ncbi:MAG: TonB-dependent receptor, partial [Bryobacteraceae bacterium]|nr:TonB-dependent receptor [Bryobacteraceae bacterium]
TTNTQALSAGVRERGRPLPGTNQWYSGTLGGPVIKDRTFFFSSYQDERQRSQSQGNVRVPTEAGWQTLNQLFPRGRSGNLDLFRDLVGTARGDSQLFNTPLGDGRPDVQFGTSVFPYAQTLTEKQWTARIDHKLSENDLLYGRFATADQDRPVAGEITSFPGLFTSQKNKYYNALISETHIFSPSLTNELRLSYNRIDLDFPLDPANELGKTAPQITIQNLTQAGLYSIGISANFPQGRVANNYVLQDTITKVFGKHSVRFGFDLLQQRSRQFAPIPARGRLNFNASAVGNQTFSAFANFVDDFGGAGGLTDRTFGSAVFYPELFRQAYFVQDRWRATQSLTISLGLRYEDFGTAANSLLKSSWSGLFNVDPITFDGPYRQPSGVKRDLNNFAPMIGIAYAPSSESGPLAWIFGQKKGVFRAGYGMGYDSFFNNIASNAQTSVPNTIATATPPSVVSTALPRGTPNLSSTLPTQSREPRPADAQTLVPGDLVNPYYQRWSAGIQRELPGELLLDVSYVGSKGTKLFLNEQLNPAVPASMQIFPAGTTAASFPAARLTGRLDALQGSRNIRTNGGDSNYHSFQTLVTRRFSGGLFATAAYTWSKLIDNGSDVFAVAALNQAQNPVVPAFLGGLQRDRSVSFLDRTHRATFTYVYALPWMKAQQGLAGRVLGGWEVSGVTSLESGPPLNITNGVDADGIDG